MCRQLLGEGFDLPEEGLELHHIFFGVKWRQLSDKYGLTVWLCPMHHRLRGDSAHQSIETTIWLRKAAQRAFERVHGHEEFMQVFGKNYL